MNEKELVIQINDLCNNLKIHLMNRNKKLLELQYQLDNLYQIKANRAFIRSKAKWMEKAEKNSSYFYKLEKRRQEKNEVNSLIINGNECQDANLIVKEISSFYSGLYKSCFSPADCENFLNVIRKHNIPKLKNESIKLCDTGISLDELDKAVNKLKLNKSPGCDDLTSNFYKHFWSKRFAPRSV